MRRGNLSTIQMMSQRIHITTSVMINLTLDTLFIYIYNICNAYLLGEENPQRLERIRGGNDQSLDWSLFYIFK